MGKKYFIKLIGKEGRVIGPLIKEEIALLYHQGKVNSATLWCTEVDGVFNPLDTNYELLNFVNNFDPSDHERGTLVKYNIQDEIKKLDELKKEDHRKKMKELDQMVVEENFAEFDYRKKKNTEIKLEIEEENNVTKTIHDPVGVKIEMPEGMSKELESNDKTVKVKNPLTPSYEKTKIIKRPDDLTRRETENELQKEETLEELVIKKEESLKVTDKTEVFHIPQVLAELKKEANQFEDVIQEKDEDLTIESSNPEVENSCSKEVKEKKGLKPIVAFCAVLILYFLIFDEKSEKMFDPKWATLPFPQAKVEKNPEMASDLLREGLKLYKKGTYPNMVASAAKFKQAFEYDEKNDNALGLMFTVYGELYPDAKDKKKLNKTLYNFFRISESRLLQNVNLSLGAATFFFNKKKYKTALYIIENYLRLGKPSLQMFSIYLRVLLEIGEFDKAKKVAEKLQPTKDKSIAIYHSLFLYYKVNENWEEAGKILKNGLEKYEDSTRLLLDLAEIRLSQNEFKNFTNILKRVHKKKAENSPSFTSELFEYQGLLAGYQGDTKGASVFFKIAIQINDTQRLRSKLAELEIGGEKTTQDLIIESKVLNLMQKSQRAVKEKKWEAAFRYAIDAVDLYPNYIPAKLLLSNIQIKRGYYGMATESLKDLRNSHPVNAKIFKTLIFSLIESFKLDDANYEINSISGSRLKDTAEYASIVGYYFYKRGNTSLAAKWLQIALKRDPLNDEDYYRLARLYLNHRRYKESKQMINKAVDLDPGNLNYKSLFGEILYELDGGETAIGYLRKLLESNPGHPRLLGDIATYYYRDGKIKDFNEYKEKVGKLITEDPSFYHFMIKSSLIEENPINVISYCESSLKLNPGDLKTRIIMGSQYLKLKRPAQAISTFTDIITRLPNYPLAHYHLAQSHILKKDYTKALEAAKKEVEYNPTLFEGHYISGEIHRLMENYPDAIKSLEKSISLNGRSPDALMALGWIKMRQNYMEQAVELYNRAKRHRPNNPEIRKQLGFIFQAIGQSSLAIEELTTYLKLHPGAPDRKKIESYIRQLK